MQITKQYVKELILEELTKADVKDIVDDAIEKKMKSELDTDVFIGISFSFCKIMNRDRIVTVR